ncbi:DeoR family transcriptional regulator [Bifidobacterium dolichotidis]|uniref:DeoR family transcriptional regulator n=1 Tax=Bifidobacterium dolichotidis TaxID=2306976 RepID=A0A430FQ39_9BIFI|nr:diacylglycerol kinase family protein [Bifidobacterium dolichotidis]RSX54936.1 DeoR family transcriptional regulator [Bifidobacterium dolichotidis]
MNGWLMALLIVVCVLVVVIGIIAVIRLVQRHRHAQVVAARSDDQVRYTFVINPSKPQAELYRERIRTYCLEHDITEISFIDTQLDKSGRICALEALEKGADVVIAVGGDGTVRTVASAMAGSGHAMGIIPIGTGNLFARNMGIPVDDVDAAIGIAISHGSRRVDIGRLSLPDEEPNNDHGHAFLIIAGIGFDALMIDDTDPVLKKNISWLAYFVSGAKHLFAPKYHAAVRIKRADGTSIVESHLAFRTFMAGNCGQIPVFSLMPDASFNDGLLDFEVIDTSGGLIGWANLFGDVVHQTIVKRAEQHPLSTNSRIDQVQGIEAELRLEKKVPVQVDGDMLPAADHVLFSVDHDSLIVRVPEPVAGETTAQFRLEDLQRFAKQQEAK